MHATYKNALMWTLYGVLFLLIAVLQTVVFGRARFFGVKLTLIPVCLACVAMLAGAEAEALYAAIRQRTDRPISHLILTHMHPDHIMGAEIFAEAGASIIADSRLPEAVARRAPIWLHNQLHAVFQRKLLHGRCSVCCHRRHSLGLGRCARCSHDCPSAQTGH